MPSIILKKYSLPQELSNTDKFNRITPLSYQEWLSNSIGIIPNQAEQQYNSYLTTFYEKKNESISGNQSSIREDYISLLKRLQVIFKDDLEFNRLANVDFEDERELKITIPYFARKLKEIALYYISKRETLKKTKLKYNLVGSNEAVEKILYEYLLQAFTRKENTVNVQNKELFNSIPELSSITNNFSIVVEELYDTTNYFDKEYADKNNKTGVYDLSSVNPLLFVLEDYIYNLYNALDLSDVPLSAISNPLSQFVLCENGNDLNYQINAATNAKYISNDVYYLTGGFYDFDTRPVSLDLLAGNNFFYWFYGEYVREIPDGLFQNIALSSIDWSEATGSESFSAADIIFISVGNKIIEGAWLSDTSNITVNTSMSATMKDGKMFKFPYPGIGVSAENIGWSGPVIEDISEFNKEFFPSEKSFIQNQENIKDLYWSSYSSISTVNSIHLNDTDLYQSGAFASNNFDKADKMIIRRDISSDDLHDDKANGVFNGTLEVAWLYNFTHTELPIIVGDTNLYYPLTSYKDISELYFKYESGNDVVLSAINVGSSFTGAIAGNSIETSDLLIKLDSVCGTAKEAAWLKGVPLSSLNSITNDPCDCSGDYSTYYTNWKFKTGTIQSSLFFKGEPGTFTRFIWTGPNTDLNRIKGFTGFAHDSTCPYYQNKTFISLIDDSFLDVNKTELFEKWKTCTCKAIHYSPLSHSKDTIDYYTGIIPDLIATDTGYPSTFGFNGWRGEDGKNFKTSKDIAWFRSNNLSEPDFGWGEGNWKNNNNEEFILETGKTYIYYRSNLNRCNYTLPFFVINEGYCDCVVNDCVKVSCIPVWQKAILNDNNVWEDAGQVSDMSLESGTFFKFTHRDSFNFSKTILTYSGNIINSLSGDYITLSSVDPKVGEFEAITSIPAVNFLIKIPLSSNDAYWGVASFEEDANTNNKLKMFGTSDFRNQNEYLQIKQPHISNTVLHNNNTIEYKMSDCNNCFIWTQPLSFVVQDAHRGWNKILTDSCIKSELLNYLQDLQCNPCDISTHKCLSECQETKICGCDNLCYPVKTGLTASNIPSDMVLNTELSSIPVFVNYFARNPFNVSFSMIEISNGVPPYGGIWVPPVSTIYTKAEMPWNNIINDLYPVVASEQVSGLSSIYDLGLFVPDKLFNGKYELRKATFDIDYVERTGDSFDIIRGQTYADGDIQVASVNSTWMKQFGNNVFSGNVKVNGNQTYYPYTSRYETTKFNNIGLYDVNDSVFSPWDSNGVWSDEFNYPANFRGQHAIHCGDNAWYNNQSTLSGNIINWQTDIFGNQYFLVNNI